MSPATRRSLLDASPVAARGGIPLLALGFRPFFLIAGVLASLLVPLWLLAFFGKLTIPTHLYGPTWHGHEMVFGFAAAVIAGFLLTAARNWTSIPTASGGWLAALVGLFLLGRAGVFFSASLPRPIVVALDLAFLPAVALALAIPIVRGRNWRNLAFVPLLLLLLATNALFHGSPLRASLSLRIAMDIILVIIAVIGGRVIPSFTANALRCEVKKTPRLDLAAMISTLAVATLEPFDPRALGIAAIASGLLHGARMLGWHSLATRRHPILWVLHVGYAFVALGLFLKGAAVFVPTWISTAPLHVLAIGAIGTLILGMITRVSLGHTGRMLVVATSIALAYGALIVATILRAILPLLAPSAYAHLLIASGVAWTAAFATFTLVYLPILIAPRVDGKPG